MPVYESWAELTEPFEASVVTVAQSGAVRDPEALLLALEVAARVVPLWAAVTRPARCWAGEPCCSAA